VRWNQTIDIAVKHLQISLYPF